MRIHDFLEYFARQKPEIEFATFNGESLTYAEANAIADRIAASFSPSGIEKGDRVAILSKNSLEYALLYYGAFKAGVVPVPLNYRLAGPEWAYIINDSAAKALIARSDLVQQADKVVGDLTTVKTRIAVDAQPPEGWQSYESWLAQESGPPSDSYIHDGDDAYIMYTSGTTGHPKGAVLTHHAVTSNLSQFATLVRIEFGERYLIVAPMYHAAAGVSFFTVVAQGGTSVIHEEFDPFAVVDSLANDVHAATLVPAMIQACLLMVPDVADRNYDKLRLIGYGASPIAEATLRRAMEVFDCEFGQGYGMTETTAVVTLLSQAAHRRALDGEPGLLLAAGQPVLGTEIRIVNALDEEVPRGEIGEIIARGPQLMRGYLNKPEATETALRGGWMHTGDAGIMDDEGFVYIQDRVKDMVVSGGENVYPREVEEVLFKHEAIADVAVIGVPSEQWGEALLAVVVMKESQQIEADSLIEYCRGKLAGYKIPRQVEFIEELPRNPSGKVLKRQLREPYWEGVERRVS